MIDPPTTIAAARERRYGRSDGWYTPSRYKPLHCAWEVSEPPYYLDSHQCSRSTGHGPDGLYCKQHARMVERVTTQPANDAGKE